ncbi:MAG: SDR family NAD(P)-dependent oxidoreductase [Candidatus Cloacimonetes bacterium]|nr:SDR family NAD(P)-dependent oxidoreductase [Candidatus Cloacimonadota bacterium]
MKTVLITGCSSGIGLESVELFQRKGWRVIAILRKINQDSIPVKLSNVYCYEIDISCAESVRKGVKLIAENHHKIDVLVNNAGIYLAKPLEFMKYEDLKRILEVNLLGTINMTKESMMLFCKSVPGIIINVSSVAGRTTFPYQSVYHASKWGLEGFSEGLNYELKHKNITVKLIEPGMVKTRLYESTKKLSNTDITNDYKHSYDRWLKFLYKNYENGYSPVLDARTIYKAATDGKNKLRYTTDFTTRFTLFLRYILPFPLFIRIIQYLCR